jgi:hypothetical protein
MARSTKLSLLSVEMLASLQPCNYDGSDVPDDEIRSLQNAVSILLLGFQPQVCQKVSPTVWQAASQNLPFLIL